MNNVLVFGPAWITGAICGQLVLIPFHSLNWGVAFGCIIGAVGQVIVSNMTSKREQVKNPIETLEALEAAATEVLRASHIGDQNFIACLRGDDAAKLRAALVALGDVFRKDADLIEVDARKGDRGRLFDANGKEIYRSVWANLRTGEVMRYRQTPSRSFIEVCGELIEDRIMFDAPLRFERRVVHKAPVTRPPEGNTVG